MRANVGISTLPHFKRELQVTPVIWPPFWFFQITWHKLWYLSLADSDRNMTIKVSAITYRSARWNISSARSKCIDRYLSNYRYHGNRKLLCLSHGLRWNTIPNVKISFSWSSSKMFALFCSVYIWLYIFIYVSCKTRRFVLGQRRLVLNFVRLVLSGNSPISVDAASPAATFSSYMLTSEYETWLRLTSGEATEPNSKIRYDVFEAGQSTILGTNLGILTAAAGYSHYGDAKICCSCISTK